MSRFRTVFLGFGKIQKSKMADQDGRPLEIVAKLLHHVTSSPHYADVKRQRGHYQTTILPSSLVIIAFIFWELRGGRGGGGVAESLPQGPRRPKLIGLNEQN